MKFWLAAALFAAACGGGTKHGDDTPGDDQSGGDGGTPQEREIVASIDQTPLHKADILLVVDDSPGMADKQVNFANDIPNLLLGLGAGERGMPDLHIGVVTTDVGNKGAMDDAPGASFGNCTGAGKNGVLQRATATITDAYLIDEASGETRTHNFMTGTVAEQVASMVKVGSAGCGFEQPLAAMKLALSNTAENAGFLRADAALAVIFLTDEDDCSFDHSTLAEGNVATLGPVQSFRCTRFGVTCASGGASSDAMNQVGPKGSCAPAVGSPYMSGVPAFVQFLRTKKPDTRRLVVGSVAGATSPFAVELRTPPGDTDPIVALAHSCMYDGTQGAEVADPPVRLKAFVDAFGAMSSSSSICQADLSGGLGDIGSKLRLALGSACVSVPLQDSDPTMPGLQPDCTAQDTVNGAPVAVVPQCGATPTAPCWHLDVDASACPAGDHVKLVVDRDGVTDPNTTTTLRCYVDHS